jgi:hypothetical protein
MKYDITFTKVILKGVDIQVEGSQEEIAKSWLVGMSEIFQGFLNVHKQNFNCESIEVVYEDRFDFYASAVPSATKAFMSYATFEGLEGNLMSCLVMLDNDEEVRLGEFYVFQEAVDTAQQYIKDHPEYEWVETYKDLKLGVGSALTTVNEIKQRLVQNKKRI